MASASAASACACCEALKNGKRITTPTDALLRSKAPAGKNWVQLLNLARTAYCEAKSTEGNSARCSARALKVTALACSWANSTAGFDFTASAVASAGTSGIGGTDSATA